MNKLKDKDRDRGANLGRQPIDKIRILADTSRRAQHAAANRQISFPPSNQMGINTMTGRQGQYNQIMHGSPAWIQQHANTGHQNNPSTVGANKLAGLTYTSMKKQNNITMPISQAQSQQHVNTNKQHQNNQPIVGSNNLLGLTYTSMKKQNNITIHRSHTQGQQHVTPDKHSQNNYSIAGPNILSQLSDTNMKTQNNITMPISQAQSQQHVITDKERQNNQPIAGTNKLLGLTYTSMQRQNNITIHRSQAQSDQHVNSDKHHQNNEPIAGANKLSGLTFTSMKKQSNITMPRNQAQSQQHVNPVKQHQNNQSIAGTNNLLGLTYTTMQRQNNITKNNISSSQTQRQQNTNGQHQNNQSLAATNPQLPVTDTCKQMQNNLVMPMRPNYVKQDTINQPQDYNKVPEGLLICTYTLECGHLCPKIDHGHDRAHKTIECDQKCQKILCHLNHVCPLMCKEQCKPCAVPVEKRLPCGHDMLVPCHRDPQDREVKCTITVTVTLPSCKHEAKKPCHMDINKVKCTMNCVFRVEKCGHACRLNCHVNEDPDHEQYVCLKPCAKSKKGCTANLMGNRGEHQCPKLCHETCDNCDVKVEKLVPGCNHKIKIACSKMVTTRDCTEPCNRTLACGHPCAQRCYEPCDSNKCSVVTASRLRAACGHHVSLPCNIADQWSSYDFKELEKILVQYCQEPCNQTLECDHICSGTCSQCHQGRVHVPCKQTCNQLNICGHQCEEPCNQVCPPCKKKCEVRCAHSQCNKRCGAPCGIPCQEKCSLACPHGACQNRCGEECSLQSVCSEPCRRPLPCGHRCRGVCGEPCLTVCSICKPHDFPKEGFIKGEFDDNDKFIQLQDCPHIVELEDMDTLMQGDSSTIEIKGCPYCRKPIINTRRYKDLVNSMFKVNINPIKEKVYGNEYQIEQKHKELKDIITRLQTVHATVIRDNVHFKDAFTAYKLSRRHVSLLELQMTSMYFEILDIVGENYTKYKKAKVAALEKEFLNQVALICIRIRGNELKISRQLQKDINNELERMGSIIKLAQIMSHPSYLQSKTRPPIKTAFEMAHTVVLSWHVYNSDVTKEALANLLKVVKVSGITTAQERKMIVRAIGLKAGHWFKCPNGHFYCIGECGGAMQIGKCVECGAPVGGTSHRLLNSNTHARELDGSSYPAWSEQNNMRNFNFDDIL